MQEVWKDVVGYKGYYQVSNTGKVRSVDRVVRQNAGGYLLRGKELKQFFDSSTGYYKVVLNKNGFKKTTYIHRLVSIAFIPNPKHLQEVNHIDEIKTNNMVTNLEWVTHIQNNRYGTKIARQIAHTDFEARARKHYKRVIQYDRNMNKIREWESMISIQKELGYHSGNISKSCKGKYINPIYGYYWRYAD